jgi:urease accessory protein
MPPMPSDAEAALAPNGARLLLIWLSPAFPVGAYAYSHGLESAVARGLVTQRADLEAWLQALIRHGSVHNDLILLVEAMRAATRADGVALTDVNALALALQPSAERYLETAQQGTSFVAAVAAAWPCRAISALRATIAGDIAYPVAVGVAAAGHAIPMSDTLDAFALAFVQNLVSAAIRLSVIGQTDGQRVLAAVMPAIQRAAAAAAGHTLADLGGAAFSADLASLEHETLYSRLFRS